MYCKKTIIALLLAAVAVAVASAAVAGGPEDGSADVTDNSAVTLYVDGVAQDFDYLVPAFVEANKHVGSDLRIVLNADAQVEQAIKVDSDITIKLEIGDYDIAGNVNGRMITNNGTLAILGDKGCVYNTDVSQQGHDAITNFGVLTIEGGWFGDTNNDMTDPNPDVNRGAAVRNYGGHVTLNGGHFTAGDNWIHGDGYAYALINGSGGETSIMAINDGVYVYGANNGNVCVNSGIQTIMGGNFSMRQATVGGHYNVYSDSDRSEVVIYGGTFFKEGGRQSWSIYSDHNGKVTVKGGEWTNNNSSMISGSPDDVVIYTGRFNKDPAAYVPEGCPITEDQGIYTVLMTVSIAVEGQDYGSVDVTSIDVPAGSEFTVDGNLLTINGTTVTAIPAPPSGEYEHIFNGWSVESGSTAEQPMTVTATFSEVLFQRTVYFFPNGGTGTMEPQSMMVDVPTSLNPNKFLRQGYIFSSWNTSADGSGTAYANGQLVVPATDLSLFAIWLQVPVADCTVTFVTNGGSAVAPAIVKVGDVADRPDNPVKENSKFAGWFSDAALTVRYTFTEPVNQDITLYAKWTDTVNVSVPAGDGYRSNPAGVTQVTIGQDFTFTIDAVDGYAVVQVAADGGIIGTGPGTYVLSDVTSDVSITVVFTHEGRTVETSESTVDNDDGSVTTNATTTESDGSGNVSITETSKTTGGASESSSTATADVSGTDVNINITSTSDTAVVSASLAEAIAAAGQVKEKDVTVTTSSKAVTIDSKAWDLLGDAAVTVTLNSDSDFEASITVSKESFSKQSALTLQVAGSDKKVPSDLGRTSKPFELTAKMGGNSVPGFENQVTVAIALDIPVTTTAAYAYCLDDGTKITAQFDPLSGQVIFEAPHFSSWTVIYEEPTSGPVMSTLLISLVIVVICFAIAITFYALRSHDYL